MSNRCPDCGKFVSLEGGDPEVNDLSIDESGEITAEVRVFLTCAECGTEMKEFTFEDSTDSEEIENHIQEHVDEGESCELTIEENSVEFTDEMVTKDRHGHQIKYSRYMKRLYGYELTATVECETCGSTFPVDMENSEQASAFEDLN